MLNTTVVLVSLIVVGFLVLYIHKVGIAVILRRIGHIFIGAGDAVDHWGAVVRDLNSRERQING